MKKVTLLPLVIALASWTVNAELTAPRYLHTQSATVSQTSVVTVPTRTVEEVEDGIVVTYTFTGASVTDDVEFNAQRLGMGGFGPWDSAGEPALFSRTDHFTLPEGFTPVVEILSAEYREILFKLAPAIPARLYSDTTSVKVLPIAPYTGFKPGNAINTLKPGDYRGQKVARIEVSPYQYCESTSTLRVYSSITYKVHYSGRNNGSRAAISDNLLPDTLDLPINPVVPPTLSVAVPKNESYLIVTVPKYEDALADFIRWKQLLGFNVHVASQPSWTPEAIKAAVRQAYADDPDLWYLLIVGSHDDVPGEYCPETIVNGVKNDAHYTDLFYACLCDDDDISDLYKGRWSVRSSDDVENIVTKSICYEQNPPTSPHFYSYAPHCSYFEHSGQGGIEDNRFIETSEDVLNYMSRYHGKSIQRIYWDAPVRGWTSPPSMWNSEFGTPNTELPDDVLSAIDDNSNFNNLVEAINEGCLYMLYRGHGSPDNFFSPEDRYSYFEMLHVNSLTNTGWPTLFFNITCSTGTYTYWDSKGSHGCLAEMLHNKCDGGALGVYAASAPGYYGYDDALTCSMFNAIWPNPGFGLQMGKNYYTSKFEDPEYRLGCILDKATMHVCGNYHQTERGKYIQEIFHLFGDPGTLFTTEVPESYNNIEINRKTSLIQVVSHDEETNISFFDHVTGKTTRMYGNVAMYSTPNPDYTTVTLSGHNKIPYIDYGEEYYEDGSGLKQNYIISCMDNHNGSVTVKYNIASDVNARIWAVDLASWDVIRADVDCPHDRDSVEFHVSPGVYAITLIVDGSHCDTKRLIVRY